MLPAPRRCENQWQEYWLTPRGSRAICSRSAPSCWNCPPRPRRFTCARCPRVWTWDGQLGFTTDIIDSRPRGDRQRRLEGVEAPRCPEEGRGRVLRRAAYEVAATSPMRSIAHAPTRCSSTSELLGALSVADAVAPRGHVSRRTPASSIAAVPPSGWVGSPLRGVLGRVRDAAPRPIAIGMMERRYCRQATDRASAWLPPVASAQTLMRRAPLMLVATASRRIRNQLGRCQSDDRSCMFEPAIDAVSRLAHGD